MNIETRSGPNRPWPLYSCEGASRLRLEKMLCYSPCPIKYNRSFLSCLPALHMFIHTSPNRRFPISLFFPSIHIFPTDLKSPKRGYTQYARAVKGKDTSDNCCLLKKDATDIQKGNSMTVFSNQRPRHRSDIDFCKSHHNQNQKG